MCINKLDRDKINKNRLYILAQLYSLDLCFEALLKKYAINEIQSKYISKFNGDCDRILDHFRYKRIIPNNIKELFMEESRYETFGVNIKIAYEFRWYNHSVMNEMSLIGHNDVIGDLSTVILSITNLLSNIDIYEVICSYIIVAMSSDDITELNISFTGEEFKVLEHVSFYVINTIILTKLNSYFDTSNLFSEFYAEYIDGKLHVEMMINHNNINTMDYITILDI